MEKEMPPEIIKLNNVTYSYHGGKKPALCDINISIAQGEFLMLMGANGGGKTSFCKLINGIIPHSCGGRLFGTVTVDGTDTAQLSVPQLACRVGTVLDDPDAQLFTSSVRREAAFGPENLLLPPQEIEKRVSAALSAAGLAGFEERSPATLSGGEKQRLVIAAALAMSPKILVLDEPLSRLDPDGRAEVLSVIADIRKKYQLTVIMATHDSNMALEHADRVCVLKDGFIAACDTAKNILNNSALLEENGIEQPAVNSSLCAPSEPLVRSPCEVSSSKASVIEIKDLSYSYSGGAKIENINLLIGNNDFIAITGGNGCGKTTLLKNITGLLRPAAGEIFIRGKNAKEMTVPAISREIGFVMQNPDSQLFTDSVFSEVSFALKNCGLPKAEIKQRVQDALKTAGLEDWDEFPHALSRADRTRTVIACILAMGSKIIILDESDAGGDFRGITNIMDTVKKLHAQGCTIIFVTHNMSLAYKYAKRIIKMERTGMVTIYEN